MNTSSKGENPISRKNRMTRAGNDANSFPFDKLSVDETALAKQIISPLANPNFPRIREPLDSTTSTVNSSDDVNTSSDEEKQTKTKQTTKAQSTDSPSGLKIADLPDKLQKRPIQPISSPSETERNERAFRSPKPIELSARVQSFGSAKSPDPEAKHISRIFRRSGSVDRSTSEEDSYYEVYDSNSAEGDDSSGEYYTDVESSGGWTSSLGQSTDHEPMTRHMSDHEPRMHSAATRIAANTLPTGKGSKSSLGSFSSEPVTSRSGRVSPDGKLHISPGHTKNLLTNKNGAMPFVKNLSRGQDPDADFEDTSSFVAEDLDPTPDETEYDSRYPSTRMSSTNERGSSSTGARAIENSSGSQYDGYSESESSDSITSPPPSFPSSASTQKRALDQLYSQFPSNRLLVFMVVMIALVAIGMIASLTFYLLERTQLDPICPPDDLCCNDPTCITFDDDDNGGIGFLDPLDPNDKELLDLFESVAGEAVRSEFTSAGMAAKWMIDEDPGRYLKSRSAQGWIQRFLLVYTYYATTLNRSTSWLSCNPAKDEGETEEDDKDACMFAYATELPGGRIVYDLVPSHRWLSAVDECQWGGVACGTTVVDEINVGNGSDIPIKSTMKRLAVTSIVLTDQYLKGSIVTELTKLPMLQTLDLSHNELQGTIDSSFNSLETLRLQYNAIQGSIPENFFDDKSVMKELNLGSNFMTGTIPEDISLASRMTELYLFNNKFTGSIPTLGNMPLVNFHGQENEFSGIMPFDYGPWPDTLREWWVYDNKLTGSLSDHLGFLENLEDFRASKNDLTGVIPDSIKDLKRLYRFDVQSNSLTGTVPEGIGELPVLRDVRLQFNKLDGIVPTSLCFMESMEVLEADCLVLTTMEEPQTDCYCCTTCCNAVFGSCQQY